MSDARPRDERMDDAGSPRRWESDWGKLVAAALMYAWVWSVPSVATAQQELSKAAQETTIPGGQLMIVSYIVLWLGLLGYVGYLGLRQRELDDEIDELEARIDETLGDIHDEE